MTDVLLIGLNSISKKIISYFKKAGYNVFGFDFSIDKMSDFRNEDLISNDPKTILNDLLKKSDFIILNIEYSQYKNVFELSPFIKEKTIIININSFKGNTEKLRKLFKNKGDYFIPCNFSFFPENIIINYDINSKMKIIQELYLNFKNIKISTSVLNPNDNDEIMATLCHIPFLLNKIFFEKNNLTFINTDYDFLYEDILLNKNIISKNLNRIFNYLSQINSKTIFNDLIESDIREIEINDEIISKIILEISFVKSLVNRVCEEFMCKDIYNFDCNNYNVNEICEYLANSHLNIETLILIIREKIYNFISVLNFEGITLKNFIKYLNDGNKSKN